MKAVHNIHEKVDKMHELSAQHQAGLEDFMADYETASK